jgi:uncharacterized protein YeaO (DUF488 family)
MLYLNTLENRDTDETKHKFTICHEKVAGIPNLVELAPSKELLRQWESQELAWEKFREQFMAELRQEFSKGNKSRLKGLTTFSLENDVTLYSPEPPGEQTYRAVLGEVVNRIWERAKRTERVIELARESLVTSDLDAESQQMMEKFAADCEFFAPKYTPPKPRSCLICEHLDTEVYACPKIEEVVIVYDWTDPLWTRNSQQQG